MTQRGQVIDFDSEDTEGSDLSYESSFDDRLEQDYDNNNNNQQRGIQIFKDQMDRFLMQNPDIQENIKLEKANFEDEEELKRLFPPKYQEAVQATQLKKVYVQISPRSSSQPNRTQPLGKWEGISKNIIQQSKKVGTMPTIEEFQQRLNLFRRQNDKSDIVDLVIEEQDRLLKEIQTQAKKKQARENALHQSIEAKVRKETGDVGYISYRKKIQFQFRIKKAEEMAQEKVEKQQRQKETEMKKSKNIFERLFQERKGTTNGDDNDLGLDGDFKSQAAEELYRKIKKCTDEIEIKQTIIQFIIQHKKKIMDEYQNKPSLLQQGTKFYSEESKVQKPILLFYQEFTLLTPNFNFKKQISQSKLSKDFFDKRDNLEDGNIYLLTKINRMLDGNLMKHWKNMQESKI